MRRVDLELSWYLVIDNRIIKMSLEPHFLELCDHHFPFLNVRREGIKKRAPTIASISGGLA